MYLIACANVPIASFQVSTQLAFSDLVYGFGFFFFLSWQPFFFAGRRTRRRTPCSVHSMQTLQTGWLGGCHAHICKACSQQAASHGRLAASFAALAPHGGHNGGLSTQESVVCALQGGQPSEHTPCRTRHSPRRAVCAIAGCNLASYPEPKPLVRPSLPRLPQVVCQYVSLQRRRRVFGRRCGWKVRRKVLMSGSDSSDRQGTLHGCAWIGQVMAVAASSYLPPCEESSVLCLFEACDRRKRVDFDFFLCI
ncbi:uncharacterized protein IWZ02DRAFT_293545 [Phyllosticta citriasiana]|uniref:uncharacterized protein n=1 Tax=Phyllosticta citriasiana TaxID=595635 RepID=UPI0030FDD63F